MKGLRNLATFGIVLGLVAALGAGCGSSRKMTKDVGTSGRNDSTSPTGDGGGVPEKPADRDVMYDLVDIRFDFDRADIRPNDATILREHGRWLTENPSTQVLIEGHCDERGTVEYNLALGEKRARAAKDFLVSYGVSSGRLETISYGKERPLDPGHDEAAWAKNRRAHFVKR